MHVVMFGDQHVESLGGAQVSMRLQRRFLELAGHTVTVVAPAMHGRSFDDPGYLDMPSVPITVDREYSLTWPGRRTDRWVDSALSALPPVDVVHVQADFWGAFIGHRYAKRHGIPIVHTMHNRVDVGIRATAPFPDLVLRVLNAWERRAIGVPADGADGWAYLRGLARKADAVTAPSSHFARRLEQHGVFDHVDVIWNGIDDEILEAAIAGEQGVRRPGPPRFVWIGRMSPEKRLLPFLEAVALSRIDAHVQIIGGGAQRAAAERLVARLAPTARVEFVGKLPYAQTLRRIGDADAVVQTSIGFETQGMTIFEAAALGTPSVVSDPDLAGEVGSGRWAVGAGGSVPALAEALREAASDITSGTARVPDASVRDAFRQSSRTAAMIAVYERVAAR